MKSGEAGFRHSRTPQTAYPATPRAQSGSPSGYSKTAGLSKRAQRRREESEARRRERKERKRLLKNQGD